MQPTEAIAETEEELNMIMEKTPEIICEGSRKQTTLSSLLAFICAALILLIFLLTRSNLQAIEADNQALLDAILKSSCFTTQFCRISRLPFCSDISQIQALIDSIKKQIKLDSNIAPQENYCENLFSDVLLDHLYNNDPKIIADREQFQRQRVKFVNQNLRFKGIQFAKYNLYSKQINTKQRQIDYEEEYKSLDKKYNFNTFKKEMPFCVVVPTYNNDVNFRVELNLNSLFIQNYSNFKVVIIDDFSSDGTASRVQKYLDFYGLNQPFVIFIKNQARKTALENLYNAFHNVCSNDDIGVTFDGDDEALGKNVLKVFNAIYQKQRPGFAYSNYYFFNQFKGQISQSKNQEIPEMNRNSRIYRQAYIADMISQIRTFKVSLFRQIKPADLQDSNGKFYSMTYDLAIMFPIMEMSCGRVYYTTQVQLLHNYLMPQNDAVVNRLIQKAIGIEVMAKSRYPCSQQFLAETRNDSIWGH